jgi:ElaB/YqjD/DUF883 family membrane-anchored ribosome-binding protein
MTRQQANRILLRDLKQVVSDAEELLKLTAGDAGEKMKELRGRLTRTLDSARATCESLQGKTAEAARATDQVIRDHVYESIGAAFGLGVLVGVLAGYR